MKKNEFRQIKKIQFISSLLSWFFILITSLHLLPSLISGFFNNTSSVSMKVILIASLIISLLVIIVCVIKLYCAYHSWCCRTYLDK